MSVLLDAPFVRAPEVGTSRAAPWWFGGLAVGAVVAADPRGLSPFGPAKWLVVSAVGVAAAGWTLWRSVDGRSVDGGGVADGAGGVGDVRAGRLWLALLAVLLLAALTSGDVPTALLGQPIRHLGFVTWCLFALVFVAGQRLVRDRDLRTVTRGLAVAAACLGGWSMWELVAGRVIDLDIDTERLTGPFGSAAYLGAAACLLGPVAVGVATDCDETRRWRGFAASGAIGTAIALIGSGTRGGWLAALVAMVLIVVRRRPSRRQLVAATLVLLAAVAVVVPRLADVLDRTAGVGSRVDEWRVAARVIVEHPVLGVGPEGYRIAVADGIDRDYERTYGRDQVLPDRAHDGPLDVALAGGLLAAALYVALLVLVARRCLRLVRRGESTTQIGLAAGVVAYGVQQLVLFPIAEIDPVWWMSAGLVMALTKADVTASRAPATRRSGRSRRLGVVALAAVPLLVVAGVLDVAADRVARRSLVDLADGRRSAAVSEAERAVHLRPDDVRYRLVAAHVLADAGSIADVRRALELIDGARSWTPDDPQVRDRWASLLLQLAQDTGDRDDVDVALVAWRSLVASDPHRARWQLQLGRAAALAGDTGLARSAWTAAADLDPRDGTAGRLLAALDEAGDVP